MSVFSRVEEELEKRGVAFSAVDIASVRSWSDGEGDRMYHAFLTQGEISSMKAMKFDKRKADFISGRIAGKRAVRQLMNAGIFKGNNAGGLDYAGIEIRRTRTGAPRVFFNNKPAWMRVSISHSPRYAASAACRGVLYRGLGIDLEKIEARDASLLGVAFREREIRSISERAGIDGAQAGQITRYWSIKEAALKSMGIGLNFDLKDIEVLEREGGEVQLVLENGVRERFESLGSSSIEVASYLQDGHYLSVAYLL